MVVLALIGWLALLAFGGYVTFAGAAMSYLSLGFTGRAPWPAILAAFVGLAIVVAVLMHAPFKMVWAG